MNEERWTDRLHLRRPTASDAEGFEALGVDLEACLADWQGDGLGYWVADRNGTLIGVVGLRFLTFRLRSAWDLHAAFAPHARGKGYALEAVEEALVTAREQSAVYPVIARTSEPFGFSLAERAGLTRRRDLDSGGLEVHVTHW